MLLFKTWLFLYLFKELHKQASVDGATFNSHDSGGHF